MKKYKLRLLIGIIFICAGFVYFNYSAKDAEASGTTVTTEATSSSSDSSRIEVSLVRTVDGDTAVFLIDGEETKVRFLAIDTEETVDPDEEATEMGYAASDYTAEALENAEKIEIEYDSESDETDYYGRTLAWIWVDDELLQLDLVEQGLAEVTYIYGDYMYLDELYAAQEEAQADLLGIWGE